MPDPGFMRIILYLYNKHRIETLVISGITFLAPISYFIIRKVMWYRKEKEVWSEATKEDIEMIEEEINEFRKQDY
jgi:hypothetical protein